MDAIIKIKLSELNDSFISRVKALFQGQDDVELTLTFDEHQNDYRQVLTRSLRDLEDRNNLTTFSLEELEVYTASKKA